MADRRRPPEEITPGYEDGGLFKTPVGQITVELVPRFALNTRQDVMVKGFVQGGAAIDVVFAGRRRALVDPILARLKVIWTRANREAAARKAAPPEAEDVRMPVRIEGCWRPRFERDDQGWQTRSHQLIAARWLITGDNGEALSFGEPPVRDQA